MICSSLSNPTRHQVHILIFVDLFNLNHLPLDHLLRASWYIKCLLQILIIIFIFCRISRLWNALSQIDINLPPTTIKNLLTCYFWSHFLDNFDTNSASVCTFHFCCPCNNCTSLTPPTPISPVIYLSPCN